MSVKKKRTEKAVGAAHQCVSRSSGAVMHNR